MAFDQVCQNIMGKRENPGSKCFLLFLKCFHSHCVLVCGNTDNVKQLMKE